MEKRMSGRTTEQKNESWFLFFDQVMVMAEDRQQRQNRLNLLTALRAMILEVGDISRIHAED